MSVRPSILVTAFGPFGGREINASSLALEQLVAADRSLRFRILPVDLVEAPRRLHEAIRRVAPEAILMLGEAANASRLRLETRAWNELDFTIPDISGRQPRARPIDRQGPAHLGTSVDTKALAARLGAGSHEVECSSDPGRYLCNRLYHAALRNAGVPALFVHLPLEHRLPPERAAEALGMVIEHLRQEG